MKGKFFVLVIAIGLSIGLAILFPCDLANEGIIDNVVFAREESLIAQDIETVSLKTKKIVKYYYKTKLLGVANDNDKLMEDVIQRYHDLYGEEFADYKLQLSSDVYTIVEYSFWQYEDKDQTIADFLYDNSLMAVDANKIDIYEDDVLKDTIYVKDQQDFISALQSFATLFTDEETYFALKNGQVISDITSYGTKDVKMYVQNTIKSTPSTGSIDEIMTSKEVIFDYLCYGRDYTLSYYTVEDGDTVYGVAYKNGLSASQVMAINDSIESLDEALIVGSQLNVTYFMSPLNIVVETQRLEKEITYPGSSVYEIAEDVDAGKTVCINEPTNGYNDVMYTEIYVNGILTSYRKESTTVVLEPITGLYHVGSFSDFDTGGLHFRLPCDNAVITCDHYCYANHHGCDFVNRYMTYCPLYAIEDFTVTRVGYESSMGYYFYGDCGNGYVVRYLHLLRMPSLTVGQEVKKNEVVGTMGSTGRSGGVHVDIGIIYNGSYIDPCLVLPCEACGR